MNANSPDAAAALSVQRVDKIYANGTVALEDARLTIPQGDFVSLLGPSGCGKSTLLKMFAGIETPTHGHMRWWGQPFDTVGSAGRRMSMVFQEATLMPWASIADNVRLPLDLAGVQGVTPMRVLPTHSRTSAWKISARCGRASCQAACRCVLRSRVRL